VESSSRDVADAAARLPLDIYRAREAGLHDAASEAIDYLLAKKFESGRALMSEASGNGGVLGTCYSSDSTATRLARDGSTELVPLSELSEGHRILALDRHFKPLFAQVADISRSLAIEDYVEIVISESGGKLKATLHHLFPLCGKSNKAIMAKDIRQGDCLHTAAGQRLVSRVARVAAKPADVTYSLKMKGGVSMINVGNVFTLAKASHHKPLAVTSTANALWPKQKRHGGDESRLKARFAALSESTKHD
jgi:hypothetical protein